MPRPKKITAHPFDVLAHQFAELVAGRLAATLGRLGGAVTNAGKAARKTKGLKGVKKVMTCRVQGCKNRSGGPYWGYICETHRKSLSKAQQQAAREAFKARA